MTDLVRVKDVMTHVINKIARTATVQDAIDMMRANGAGSLAVERRDRNDEYGLISVSDIASKVMAEDRAPERVNVYEVMSKPVITVHGDMDIRYAMRLLTKFGVSRAMVLDPQREPLGIVTLRDMVFRPDQNREAVSQEPASGTADAP
ncbi:CBS domain-containing protein [Magnetospira thiophila]